jgi:hypothetical protein
VDDPSDPAFTERVDVAMCAYEHAPATETTLTAPSEVLQAIEGLKVGKSPGPNGIPNRVLRHLPKRAVTFLTKVFNAVLRRHYFPTAWKQARVVYTLKLETFTISCYAFCMQECTNIAGDSVSGLRLTLPLLRSFGWFWLRG